MRNEPAKALTIGGSDSGGAAGVQADLKTWTALGVYGMSAISAVTAQNSLQVAAVHYLPARFVAAQMEAVLTDYGAQAIKTGFLGRAASIRAIAAMLRRWTGPPIVIDPVLVNHHAQPMFSDAVLRAYRRHLLPLASLVTPNVAEAALLAGLPAEALRTAGGLEQAATRLRAAGARQVLITGVPEGEYLADWWWHERARRLPMPLLKTSNTHGSGDTLSAAICAYLARGRHMEEAIMEAQRYTAAAIERSRDWRLGAGHGPLGHFRDPAA